MFFEELPRSPRTPEIIDYFRHDPPSWYQGEQNDPVYYFIRCRDLDIPIGYKIDYLKNMHPDTILLTRRSCRKASRWEITKRSDWFNLMLPFPPLIPVGAILLLYPDSGLVPSLIIVIFAVITTLLLIRGISKIEPTRANDPVNDKPNNYRRYRATTEIIGKVVDADYLHDQGQSSPKKIANELNQVLYDPVYGSTLGSLISETTRYRQDMGSETVREVIDKANDRIFKIVDEWRSDENSLRAQAERERCLEIEKSTSRLEIGIGMTDDMLDIARPRLMEKRA